MSASFRPAAYIALHSRMNNSIESSKFALVGKHLRRHRLRLIHSVAINMLAEQVDHLSAYLCIFDYESFGFGIAVIHRIAAPRYTTQYGRFAASYASCYADDHNC